MASSINQPPPLFTHNLELLALQDRSLAEKVRTLQEIPPLAESTEQTEREAAHWFKGLSLKGKQIIYIYGVGLGDYYQAASSWLHTDPNHRLVFLEDDLSAMSALLRTEKGQALLEDLQVELWDFSEHAHSTIQDLIESHLSRNYCVTVLSTYRQEKWPIYSLLEKQIAFEVAEQQMRYPELASFGLPFFNNFYHNLLQLPLAYDIEPLLGCFQGVPAIICGAGPSLRQSLPLLSQLGERALLFGPGSAMNILNFHHIWPHFGVAIDPTPDAFHRIMMQRAFEIPVFYRNRLYYEALTAIHALHLFVPDSPFYPTPRWFEEQLGITAEPLEGGYSVMHTAIEIAYRLGCNPIILVGLDLSFKPGGLYAEGVEHHPLYPSSSEESKPHLGLPIEMRDIHGESIFSYWPWIAEAQWIDFFAHRHPETTFINATAGGIGLFSIPHLSLEKVMDQQLQKTYPLQEKIDQAIQQGGELEIKLQNVLDCLRTFHASLKRCEKGLFQRLQGSAEILVEELPTTILEEVAFQFLLQAFDQFYSITIKGELRQLPRLPLQDQEETKKSLAFNRILFLWETSKIHLMMIENVFKESLNRPNFAARQAVHTLPSRFTSHRHTGTEIYYYANGAIKTRIDYQEGKLHGIVQLYTPEGQLKRELHFAQGKREGWERSWYDDGQLFTEIEYEQNRAKQARCWFSDGRLAKEIS